MGVDDISSRLGEISQPALIVHGEADQAIPLARGEMLRDGLPGAADLIVIPAAGHTPSLTHPDQVTARLPPSCGKRPEPRLARLSSATTRRTAMPMIDVYAAAGTFGDGHQLARDLARTLMAIEQVPDIPMFRQNTAAFVHDLPADSLSNVDGDSSYVRVQVLTNASALDREKQLALVSRLTEIVAAAGGDPTLTQRTWVLLTEAPEGGWGLAGHANTNAELVAAARAELAALRNPSS
jgi:phenylpyruvate tautomerase PptA (4-oxalocrotonate tautomerase family)